MRRALQLRLGNKANSCYMNSFVQAVLWTLVFDMASLLPQMGRSAQFFRNLLHPKKSVKYLSQDMTWKMLTSGWKEPARQHDVVEFASFFSGRHDIQLVQGEWEARDTTALGVGVGRPCDEGSSTQPILLNMPNSPPGLAAPVQVQSLVDDWHVQTFTHAFLRAPTLLQLQLARFSVQGGRIQKLHTNIHVNQALRVPEFCTAGVEGRHVSYVLRAVINHHGQHPKAGHYQATLYGRGHCWSCDDMRASEWLVSPPEWQCTTCYLLLYQRMSESDVT